MQVNKPKANNFLFPLIILGLILITYGYQLFSMGFYWDDWMGVFLSNLDVPNVFWNYYLYDRPFSAWTYLVTFPLLGNHPEAWYLFTMIIRWLGAIAFWLTLRGLWPGRAREVAWMTVLWAVFPGFYQQTISVAYSQHFITYFIFNLSLVTLVWAYRKPKWFNVLMGLSFIFTLASMLTMEYFIGLEGVRLVILWLFNRQEGEKFLISFRRTVQKAIPYIIIYLGFAYYRFIWLRQLLGKQPANELLLIEQLGRTPFQALTQLFEYILRDLIYLNFFAWLEPIKPEDILINAKSYWFAFFVGILLAILIALYINKKIDMSSAFDKFQREAFLIGGTGMLFGGIPVWAMGELVTEGRWSDRFALAPMFGVIIFFVVLTIFIVHSVKRESIIFVFILGIAIAYQMRIVNDYRKNWIVQRDFYWQMSWRIPGIEPKSTFMSPTMPFGTVAEYSISYALNTLFNPEMDSTDLYTFYFSALRYKDSLFGGFQKDIPFKYSIRSIEYESNTSKSLVFYWIGDSCYWITEKDDVYLPDLGLEDQSVIQVSNPEMISQNRTINQTNLNTIFSPEPPQTWCYFYQKGELSAQFGDWGRAMDLWHQAELAGENPEHGREYLPFIKSAAMLNDWNFVIEKSENALSQSPDMDERMCVFWQRLAEETPSSSEKDHALNLLVERYQCK